LFRMPEAISFPSEDEVRAAWEGGTLGGLIELHLGVLLDEPLAYIGRAADLVWIGFGEVIHAPSQLDPDRRLARYSLHVQCPFRVEADGRTLLGSGDIYVHPDTPEDTPLDFDWDCQGENLFDHRAVEFNERLILTTPRVAQITGDANGGLTVDLTGRLRLQLFPSTSYSGESWRFFLPNGPHFVVLEVD